MCGIVGILTKSKRQLYDTHLNIFEEMLICDSIRGNDSTGAFTVLQNNQVKAIKVATNPHYMLETAGWKKFRSTAIKSGHLLVGHNRKATYGTITRENAHPFIEKNIILIHNGTVSDHKKMADVEVDSHAICHQIANDGYKKTLEGLKGAYALVWYDINLKKLYMVRNKERPLCVVDHKDYFAFASEGMMLGWLLRRNNFEVPKVEMIAEDEVMSFSWGPFTTESEVIKQKTDYTTPVWVHQGESLPFSPPVIITPIPPDSKLAAMHTAYPRNSKVIFCPNHMAKEQLPGARFKLKGIAYLPTKPVFTDATAFLEHGADEADADDLLNEQKLVATISSVIISQDDTVHVYLREVRVDKQLGLWNNVSISELEWKYFVEHVKCDICKHDLIYADHELTSITKEKDGYKVVCCDCVCANQDDMPVDLQTKIQKVKELENYAE